MKRWMQALEKWGHYPLAALCAAVILLSAVWTKGQPLPNAPNTLALRDQSQRLADAAQEDALALVRPLDGTVLRPCSDLPVFLPQPGLWQTLPGMDFAAAPGDPVRAMAAGTVRPGVNSVTVDHGDGRESRYENVSPAAYRPGQTVRAGDVIASAAGGPVRVLLLQNGISQRFGLEWVDNSANPSYNEPKRSIPEG